VARLYKRPGSPFWWTWGRYADGSRWQASTRVPLRERRRAEQAAIKLAAERGETLHRPAKADRLTVTAAFDDVIAARRREGKVEGTIDVYVRVADHCCRILGAETELAALTLADLERYIDVRRREGTMRSTIAQEFAKLGAAFNYAHRHGRYKGDVKAIWPAAALRNAYKPRERFMTRDEYAALHAFVAQYGRGDWLAGYVYTGARRRELPRVTAADVNLERGTLRIRGTKTTGADRTIPIAAPLRPVIERRLLVCGDGPLWPEWIPSKALGNACAKLGIPRVNCNDLRRTFCSWLAQAGVSEMVAARLMGHGSSRMVRAVYARFGADDLAAAVARL
jgi:integrase